METNLDEPPSYFLFIEIFTTQVLGYCFFFIVLLILSALVSGSEVAFFSLTGKNISDFKNENKNTSIKVLKLLENPQKLLATILILNNFINIAIVTLAMFFTWELLGTRQTEGAIIVTLTIIITILIVFFGEVMPKVYASQNNVSFAKITAPLLLSTRTFFSPLSWVLMNLSGIIEKRFKKKGYEVSVDELNQALEIATDETTSDAEKEILKGIVNFGTLSVKQVMKSRMDITAFDVEFSFHELLDKINKSGFSRVPIFKETVDNIVGILYIKDMLPFVEEEETFDWKKLLRPGYFVPENKKIDSLLKDFQEKRVHMAIVVDEYGGTSGLITLEDIIEEIVGEINDEFDIEDTQFNKLDERTYVFDGKISLNDFCKAINEDTGIFDGVKGESESLGGLILEINNTLPRGGEKVYFDRFIFTVISVDNRRIKKVRVYLNEK